MIESTVFYVSFYEALKECDDKTFAEVWKALCEYAFYDNEVELTGVSKSLFLLMKPQVMANKKKRTLGCKGGRPKKTLGFEIKTLGFENDEKEKPNVNVNVNENVNVNDNDNESIHDSDESTPSPSDESLVKSSRKNKVVEKQKYGVYRHVELSTEEYERLQQDFPTEYLSMIQKLDEYIETHRGTERKYKNHNLVMRNWYRKDGSSNYVNKTSTTSTEDKPKPDHYVAWQLKHHTEESKPILI